MTSNVAEMDSTVTTLLAYDQYIADQIALEKILASGVLALAKSKKAGSTIPCVEDLRMDFEPQVWVEDESHSLHQDENMSLSLQLFSGMPNTHLRSCQRNFLKALTIIRRLADSRSQVFVSSEDLLAHS